MPENPLCISYKSVLLMEEASGFNVISEQRKLVTMNHPCSYVLKTNTLVIISKGRSSIRI